MITLREKSSQSRQVHPAKLRDEKNLSDLSHKPEATL